jgi:hypothetical protein
MQSWNLNNETAPGAWAVMKAAKQRRLFSITLHQGHRVTILACGDEEPALCFLAELFACLETGRCRDRGWRRALNIFYRIAKRLAWEKHRGKFEARI